MKKNPEQKHEEYLLKTTHFHLKNFYIIEIYFDINKNVLVYFNYLYAKTKTLPLHAKYQKKLNVVFKSYSPQMQQIWQYITNLKKKVYTLF